MQRTSGINWNALAMGLPLGIAVGIAMDQWIMGIPIGIMFGIAFGGFSRPTASEETEEPDRSPGS